MLKPGKKLPKRDTVYIIIAIPKNSKISIQRYEKAHNLNAGLSYPFIPYRILSNRYS